MTTLDVAAETDYTVSSSTYTYTISRSVTIEAGTFALYVKGGFLDGSLVVVYEDSGLDFLDMSLVIPSDPLLAFYDPDWFSLVNGKLYNYYTEDTDVSPAFLLCDWRFGIPCLHHTWL
jgi:hypothetical protein